MRPKSVFGSELRGRRLNGYKFVQATADRTVFCGFRLSARPIWSIEVDGSQHAEVDRKIDSEMRR